MLVMVVENRERRRIWNTKRMEITTKKKNNNKGNKEKNKNKKEMKKNTHS